MDSHAKPIKLLNFYNCSTDKDSPYIEHHSLNIEFIVLRQCSFNCYTMALLTFCFLCPLYRRRHSTSCVSSITEIKHARSRRSPAAYLGLCVSPRSNRDWSSPHVSSCATARISTCMSSGADMTRPPPKSRPVRAYDTRKTWYGSAVSSSSSSARCSASNPAKYCCP